MAKHARLSPSSSARWLTCLASPILEGAAPPDKSNEFSAQGTAAHHLAALCLEKGFDASAFKGDIIHVDEYGDCEMTAAAKAPENPNQNVRNKEYNFKVDAEMVDNIQAYIELILGIVNTTGGTLLVEQRLPIDSMTLEKNATGTSDIVIITDGELIIADLKYGMRRVNASENSQLMMYAAAAYEEYSLVEDFKTVRMIISQPRLSHVDEYVISVEELEMFAANVMNTAQIIHTLTIDQDLTHVLKPTQEGCLYCRAKNDCPALIKEVYGTIIADFEDLTAAPTEDNLKYDVTTLENSYNNIGLIQDWIKNIEAQVKAKLEAGEKVGGLKLVQGRQGNRKWGDTDLAESTMRSMRIKVKDMYEQSLISPTAAAALVKSGGIGEQQWEKLQELITRPEGKPTIVKASDPRTAINQSIVDEFDILN